MNNRRRVQLMLNTLLNVNLVPNSLRPRLLKLVGVTVGPGVFFSPGSTFIGDAYMTVGKDAGANSECLFDFTAPITIGEAVWFGPQCTVVTGAHHIGPSHQRGGDLLPLPVTIGAGSWLGVRVTVLPGVTIAPGCVIAAGAVVTKDTEPDGLYAGVPAKRIKDLPV